MIKPWMFKPKSGLPLSGWSYRKSITLSRSSGAVTNHRMMCFVSESGVFSPLWMQANNSSTFYYIGTGYVTYPYPAVASASSELLGSNDAFRAFSSASGDSWIANATTGWIKIDLSSEMKRRLTSYQIKDSNTGTGVTRSPRDWTVQGSNDDINWTTVDTVSGETGWTTGETRTYTCDSPSSTAFRYYKVVVTANNGDANYLTIGKIMLISPEASMAGKGKSDFSDLRFTTADGSTLLDYYIESLTGTTPNQLATIWIEFDSIGTSATTFYMYYGNSSASAVSSGVNTFILFEDFNSLSVGDLNGQNSWSGSASFDVQNSVVYEGSKAIEISGASIQNIDHAVTVDSYKVWVEARVRYAGWQDFGFSIYLEEGGNQISGFGWGTTDNYISHLRASQWDSVSATTPNTWYKVKLALDSASTHKLWVNDVLKSLSNNSNITNVSGNVDAIRLQQYSSSSSAQYCDLIKVGDYLATEPTWGSWGAQETA